MTLPPTASEAEPCDAQQPNKLQIGPLCDVRSVLSAGPHTSKQVRRNSLEPFTSSRQPWSNAIVRGV